MPKVDDEVQDKTSTWPQRTNEAGIGRVNLDRTGSLQTERRELVDVSVTTSTGWHPEHHGR